jgi:hypothetical protein
LSGGRRCRAAAGPWLRKLAAQLLQQALQLGQQRLLT